MHYSNGRMQCSLLCIIMCIVGQVWTGLKINSLSSKLHQYNFIIEIYLFLVISSVSITPTNPSGIAGESTITLTCTVSLSELGTPSITWSGPITKGPVTPNGDQTSFTDTFKLMRVRQSYAGVYTCMASIGASTMIDTVTVSVTG